MKKTVLMIAGIVASILLPVGAAFIGETKFCTIYLPNLLSRQLLKQTMMKL